MVHRVAVVGSGVSGLAAAWLLRRVAEVTVYERDATAGGHVNTVDVDGLSIDTGFIVHNDRNYPMFTRFLASLGVATQPSDMSFGASLNDARIEWAGDSPSKLFAQRRLLASAGHWRMLADIVRFNRDAKRALAGDDGQDDDLNGSLGAFVDARGYGRGLVERYLLPMAGAIWSTPTHSIRDFPARTLLRFLDNHGLLGLSGRPQWRTITGGSRCYVDAVSQSLGESLRRNTTVTGIKRNDNGLTLHAEGSQPRHYDHVVMACHPPTSRRIVADLDAREESILGAFSFSTNRATLHSDPRLMPKSTRAWSCWNVVADDTGPTNAPISVIYWMNRLQRLPATTQYFVSLNGQRAPRAERTIYETVFEHPVFDHTAIQAQSRLEAVQGRGGLWHCGAWTANGFHEDGFASAVRVARRLGADTSVVAP